MTPPHHNLFPSLNVLNLIRNPVLLSHKDHSFMPHLAEGFEGKYCLNHSLPPKQSTVPSTHRCFPGWKCCMFKPSMVSRRGLILNKGSYPSSSLDFW
jgi:hypothetical protein